MQNTNRINDWATAANFAKVVMGSTGFATYQEFDGGIVAADEIDYGNDAEVETAIGLDEIVHPLPSASVACELCGEHVDRYDRCGCDY